MQTRKIVKLTFLLMAVALLLLPGSVLAGTDGAVEANNSTVLSMRSLDAQAVGQAGDQFTVDVQLNNAILAGAAFEVSFDPAVLAIVKDLDGNSITANPEVFKQAPDDFGPNPFYRKDTSSSVRLDGMTSTVYYGANNERLLQPLDIGAEPATLGTIKFVLLQEATQGTRLDFSLHELIDGDANYILHDAVGLTLMLPPATVEPPVITEPTGKVFSQNPAPVIFGTGIPGALLRVFDGGSLVGNMYVSYGGDWNLQIGPLSEGVHVLNATQDVEGAVSLPSNQVRYIVDTIAPVPPVITSPQDGSTQITLRPVISGTGEKKAVVTVFDNDLALGTATVDDRGQWSLNLNSDLTNFQTYSIKANQADLAGNTSVFSNTVTFTVNTQAEGGVLDRIVVSPQEITLGEGRSVTFKAICYDNNGVQINPVVFWETQNDFGSIEQTGAFTAESAGTETVVARAHAGGVTREGYATVNILDLPTVVLLPETQQVGVGRQFTVDICLEEAIQSLYDFQFDVNFDSRYLQALSASSASLLSTNQSDVFSISDIDNGNGRLTFGETLIGDKTAENVLGTAAVITFKVRDGLNLGGQDLLTMINLPFETAVLEDGSLNPIEVSTQPAQVNIIGGGTIQGIVTLPYKIKYDGNNNPLNKDFSGAEVSLENSGGVVSTTATDQDGFYSLVGVPDGTYKVIAKKYGYLTQEYISEGSAFITISGANIVQADITLPYGEFGDGKVINITDLAKIARQFNKVEGQDGYDILLDWNRDGKINITDIAAAAKNFNKKYTPQPWV